MIWNVQFKFSSPGYFYKIFENSISLRPYEFIFAPIQNIANNQTSISWYEIGRHEKLVLEIDRPQIERSEIFQLRNLECLK